MAVSLLCFTRARSSCGWKLPVKIHQNWSLKLGVLLLRGRENGKQLHGSFPCLLRARWHRAGYLQKKMKNVKGKGDGTDHHFCLLALVHRSVKLLAGAGGGRGRDEQRWGWFVHCYEGVFVQLLIAANRRRKGGLWGALPDFGVRGVCGDWGCVWGRWGII